MTGKTALSGKYQAYPEYKDSGLEWLNVIPTDWTVSKVKHLCNFQVGWTPPTAIDTNFIGDNLWANISDLKGKYIEHTTKQISDAAADAASMNISPKGSLLYSFKLSVGAVSFATKDMYTNEAIASFLDTSKLPLPYLYYALPKFVIENASTNIYGARILNQELINNAFLLEPSFEEAEQIASFLDHETAQIDTLIDKQQQLIQLLKEKRQAVISHAVTKGLNPNAPMRDSGVEWLGEVPEHWENSKIKFISELTPRKTEVAAYKDSTCSFIPMEKLKKDLLILDEIRNVSEVFDGYTYFRDEDLLVAKVTPCFENQNMVVARGLHNGIGFGSSEIYVLRAQINNLNNFLYYRLQEDVFMEMATSEMTGAGGLRRVPSEFLSNFQLALPPEKERLEIVDFIKDYVSKFDMLMGQAEEAINLMQERRTALISAAVTGKIDVRHHAIKANRPNPTLKRTSKSAE